MLTDPFVLRGLAVMVVAFILMAAFAIVLKRVTEALGNFDPPQQRRLNAAYARFHLFLATVQLVALRRFR